MQLPKPLSALAGHLRIGRVGVEAVAQRQERLVLVEVFLELGTLVARVLTQDSLSFLWPKWFH